jgi:hypothetical protein
MPRIGRLTRARVSGGRRREGAGEKAGAAEGAGEGCTGVVTCPIVSISRGGFHYA